MKGNNNRGENSKSFSRVIWKKSFFGEGGFMNIAAISSVLFELTSVSK